MGPNDGLWSALAIIAALLVAIGIFFIAARVFTSVRARRARELRGETHASRVVEAHTERERQDTQRRY